MIRVTYSYTILVRISTYLRQASTPNLPLLGGTICVAAPLTAQVSVCTLVPVLSVNDSNLVLTGLSGRACVLYRMGVLDPKLPRPPFNRFVMTDCLGPSAGPLTGRYCLVLVLDVVLHVVLSLASLAMSGNRSGV